MYIQVNMYHIVSDDEFARLDIYDFFMEYEVLVTQVSINMHTGKQAYTQTHTKVPLLMPPKFGKL